MGKVQKPRNHACPQCPYTAGNESNLIKHVRNVHEKRKDHACPQCDAAFGEAGNLRKHVRIVHEKRRDHACPQCDAAFGQAGHLRTHVRTVHSKRKDHACPHCAAAFGEANTLRTHVRTVHEQRRDHVCQVPECHATFGQAGNLQAHLERIHDIGAFKCDYCWQNRNTSIPHEDPELKQTVHICRKCLKQKTGRAVNSRIELTWRKHLEQELGIEYLLGCDKSCRALGGCSLKRPDWIAQWPQFVELGECDEKQHGTYNGGSSCEDKRIDEIYNEDGIRDRKMVVLRWNPDGYKPPGRQAKVTSLKDRLAIYVALNKHLRAHPPVGIITIYYLFYSRDSSMISETYPVHRINSMEDIKGLSG
jgi:hypothetical protein